MRTTEFILYEPNSGTANCYHCGDWYQVTPCSLGMASAVLKQFQKEHKKCKKAAAGEARLAQVVADKKGKPGGALGNLGLRQGATLGEKIAHHMEMGLLSNALSGGEIPEELRNNPKFMKAIEEMRAAGVTVEAVCESSESE